MGIMFISTEGGNSSKNPLCNLPPSPLELIQTMSRTWDHVSALSVYYGGLRLTDVLTDTETLWRISLPHSRCVGRSIGGTDWRW